MLSTTPLASGSLVASPMPPTLPHLTPSLSHAVSHVDPPTPLPHIIFHVEPPTSLTSLPPAHVDPTSPDPHYQVDQSLPLSRFHSGPSSAVPQSQVDSSIAPLPPSDSHVDPPTTLPHVSVSLNAAMVLNPKNHMETSVSLPEDEPFASSVLNHNPESHPSINSLPTFSSTGFTPSGKLTTSLDAAPVVTAENINQSYSSSNIAPCQVPTLVNTASQLAVPVHDTPSSNAVPGMMPNTSFSTHASSNTLFSSIPPSTDTSPTAVNHSSFVPAPSPPMPFTTTLSPSDQPLCNFTTNSPSSHTDSVVTTVPSRDVPSTLSSGTVSTDNSPVSTIPTSTDFTTSSTTSFPASASVFPLSIPTFLNPFSTENDVESDTQAVSASEVTPVNPVTAEHSTAYDPTSYATKVLFYFFMIFNVLLFLSSHVMLL